MRKRQFTWSAAAGRVVTASETVLLPPAPLTTCTGERRQRRTFRHVGDNARAGPIRHRRANPANEHRAVAAKVASENFEKTTSRQGGLGQTGDNARAGHRPVKIKHTSALTLVLRLSP